MSTNWKEWEAEIVIEGINRRHSRESIENVLDILQIAIDKLKNKKAQNERS